MGRTSEGKDSAWYCDAEGCDAQTKKEWRAATLDGWTDREENDRDCDCIGCDSTDAGEDSECQRVYEYCPECSVANKLTHGHVFNCGCPACAARDNPQVLHADACSCGQCSPGDGQAAENEHHHVISWRGECGKMGVLMEDLPVLSSPPTKITIESLVGVVTLEVYDGRI